MLCAICQAAKRVTPGKLRVLRTRDKGSHVERDRGCPVCDASYITLEHDKGFIRGLQNEAENLRHKLKEAAERLAHYDSPGYQYPDPEQLKPRRVQGFP